MLASRNDGNNQLDSYDYVVLYRNITVTDYWTLHITLFH
jgi:hypothetical protein